MRGDESFFMKEIFVKIASTDIYTRHVLNFYVVKRTGLMSILKKFRVYNTILFIKKRKRKCVYKCSVEIFVCLVYRFAIRKKEVKKF